MLCEDQRFVKIVENGTVSITLGDSAAGKMRGRTFVCLTNTVSLEFHDPLDPKDPLYDSLKMRQDNAVQLQTWANRCLVPESRDAKRIAKLLDAQIYEILKLQASCLPTKQPPLRLETVEGEIVPPDCDLSEPWSRALLFNPPKAPLSENSLASDNPLTTQKQ